MTRTILVVAALLLAGCDQGVPTAPTREVLVFNTNPGPTIFVDLSGPPPPPPLPPTLPVVAGQDWRGTLTLYDSIGQIQIQVPAAVVTQSDRAISGSWRSSSASPQGSFSGTLTGVGGDTRLTGTLTILAPSANPSVACTIRGNISGPAWPALLYWEAPTVTITGCSGSLYDVRLALYR